MPKIHNKTRVSSLDCETTGLDLHHGAKPFFVTMCNEDGGVQYWEADVDPLTRQPQWNKLDLLEIEKFIDEADELILQNPKFDLKALDQIDGLDCKWNWSVIRDTLLAGHLLCSNQPHDLATMALIYLRINIQPLEDKLEVAVKEAAKIAKNRYPLWAIANRGRLDMPSAKKKVWKNDMWLPRAIAIAEGYSEDHEWWTVLEDYGNSDSSITLLLYDEQSKLLKLGGLWDIYRWRLDLLPSIYDMECCGLTIDKDRKDKLYQRLTKESEECRERCLELTDHEIENLPVNGMSNDLRYALFEKFGLKSNKKTPNGKPSGDKFVLDHWLSTLPKASRPWKFVDSLRKYRKRKTALGYMDSYEKFWLPYRNSTRIVHPSYNPTGSDTLRFSSQNPNAQQVSKQEEANTRYCFGPAEGHEWWALDFSNLELRIPAYESNEEDMVYLFDHPDDPPYYGSYHMMIFDTLHPEKFAKHGMKCKEIYESTYYQWTKNGDFAVQYGAVEKSGTADRAYHVSGAQRRIMSRFSNIKKLSEKWISYAKKHGFVETLPDKTVDPSKGYPLYCTRTRWGGVLETVPLSYHVQGTAMWITSKAMIKCHKYLQKTSGRMICQVHDEIIFDFPKDQGKIHIRKLSDLMCEPGIDVGVPLRTTVHYHPVTWAEHEEVV